MNNERTQQTRLRQIRSFTPPDRTVPQTWTDPSACNISVYLLPIGGDLLHVLGDGVGALAPRNCFCRTPRMRNRGAGDSLSLGNKCWLSIIMYWRCIYCHIFYPL